jgi:hypothetical protein
MARSGALQDSEDLMLAFLWIHFLIEILSLVVILFVFTYQIMARSHRRVLKSIQMSLARLRGSALAIDGGVVFPLLFQRCDYLADVRSYKSRKSNL